MAKYKLAILGMGAIFNRHLMAVKVNSQDFVLSAYYDPNPDKIMKWRDELAGASAYTSEIKAFEDPSTNCVVILSPSFCHYRQAKAALNAGKHVILEKPAVFNVKELDELSKIGKKHRLNIFCVLQVRLNPSIELVKTILNNGLLGNIRGTNLVQRWQRPNNYFTDWRGREEDCGGILNEFAIHYLDILQYLLGIPKVTAALSYQTKFKTSSLADSIYALFDFGSFGGSLEVNLACEPQNIEVSLMILGSEGFIKLGGKSLDLVVDYGFNTDNGLATYNLLASKLLNIEINNQIKQGACGLHPELYSQFVQNPSRFELEATRNVIELINQIKKEHG